MLRKRYHLRLRPTAHAWALNVDAAAAMASTLAAGEPIDRFFTRRAAEAARRRLGSSSLTNGLLMEPYVKEVR